MAIKLNERFALFAGDIYYPSGGMDDLIGRYPTQKAAEEAARIGRAAERQRIDPRIKSHPPYAYEYDWWQVVDLTSFKIVATSQ